MNSPKACVALAFLAILIFVLQNTDGRQCLRKNYVCPNTTIVVDTLNPVTYRAFQIQFIRDVFTSSYRPQEGKSVAFIAKILQHVDTDSQTLLNQLFTFAYRSLSYLAVIQNTPNLCVAARSINASVAWKLSRDGNAVANVLRTIGTIGSSFCTIISSIVMNELGCDNVPEPPASSPRCAGRGTIIPLKEAMELFGSSLPCCIYSGVFDLNESPVYVDKVLSVSFVLSITPEFGAVFNSATLNTLMEFSYMMLSKNTSVCCCSKIQRRINQLCPGLNSTVNQNIQTLIDEVYLLDECATEK